MAEQFNSEEADKRNFDRIVVALNNSDAKSGKGATELGRLLTAADKRQAKADAIKDKRDIDAAAAEEKQQQALDKLTGFGKFGKKMQMAASKKAKLMC